ncbi:unnamed protein product [Clonostachys chloroleuca]|uniref:Uncharacterized protein n=1 Tax=Clonostachys chloroleuca TaxID=1926264 RepID=A0AA35LXA9_9HYPO|nr:unnamed protein product [Clonostachys chloroleuca]
MPSPSGANERITPTSSLLLPPQATLPASQWPGKSSRSPNLHMYINPSQARDSPYATFMYGDGLDNLVLPKESGTNAATHMYVSESLFRVSSLIP